MKPALLSRLRRYAACCSAGYSFLVRAKKRHPRPAIFSSVDVQGGAGLLLAGAVLLLSSCGYHLAGQGRGAVPADVSVLSITASDGSAHTLLPAWKRYVRNHAQDYTVGESGQSDAELRLGGFSESFNPVSFGATGVAVTYHLVFSGQLSLWRKDVRLWNSGPITVQGDVYAVGGPSSIEASRARLRRDLNRQWIHEAWLKLSSGF